MRMQAKNYSSRSLFSQPRLMCSLWEFFWAFLAALLVHVLVCLFFATYWQPAEFVDFSSGGGGGGGFWLRLGTEGVSSVAGAGQDPTGENVGGLHAQNGISQAESGDQVLDGSDYEVSQSSVIREPAAAEKKVQQEVFGHNLTSPVKRGADLQKKIFSRSEKKKSGRMLEAPKQARAGNSLLASAAGNTLGGGGPSLGHGKGLGDGDGNGIGLGRGSGSGGGIGSGHGSGTGSGSGPGTDAAEFGGNYGPSFLRYSPPEYPASARRRGESGVVLLEVWITADGRARRVDIIKGVSDALDRAAADSVKRARFVPYRKDGLPKDCRTRIPVRFRLR